MHSVDVVLRRSDDVDKVSDIGLSRVAPRDDLRKIPPVPLFNGRSKGNQDPELTMCHGVRRRVGNSARRRSKKDSSCPVVQRKKSKENQNPELTVCHRIRHWVLSDGNNILDLGGRRHDSNPAGCRSSKL